MDKPEGEKKSVKGERSKAKGNENPVQMDFFGEAERPPLKKLEEVHNSNPDSNRDENGEALNEVNPHSELNKSAIVNRKFQMEVHHHPEPEKKGFKEYLLEGLMIFIAVMMGFFAESIRENITNGEHAKQLTTQLVNDLKNDTTKLQGNIVQERKFGKGVDSLFVILQQPLAKIDKKKLQWLVNNTYNIKLFYPSLGAITAIKNELHIRQFANSKISFYITIYEDRAKILKELENVQTNNLTTDIRAFFIDHFTPVNMRAVYNERPPVNGDMRNLTQDDITRLGVQIVLIGGFNKDMISYDKKLKADAVNLMQYVTKQFHLEDE